MSPLQKEVPTEHTKKKKKGGKKESNEEDFKILLKTFIEKSLRLISVWHL